MLGGGMLASACFAKPAAIELGRQMFEVARMQVLAKKAHFGKKLREQLLKTMLEDVVKAFLGEYEEAKEAPPRVHRVHPPK